MKNDKLEKFLKLRKKRDGRIIIDCIDTMIAWVRLDKKKRYFKSDFNYILRWYDIFIIDKIHIKFGEKSSILIITPIYNSRRFEIDLCYLFIDIMLSRYKNACEKHPDGILLHKGVFFDESLF